MQDQLEGILDREPAQALSIRNAVSTCKDKCIEVSSQCFRFINPNIGKHISRCKVVLR